MTLEIDVHKSEQNWRRAVSSKLAVLSDSAVLQMVSFETGAVATGTTTFPIDNTIPQNTEGDQYMSLAITPKSATSKLVIEVVAIASSSGTNNLLAALFQDSTADALACARARVDLNQSPVTISFRHVMTSGTTSATTFKVRIGGQGGISATTTFNGDNATARYGGTLASSIVIRECAA